MIERRLRRSQDPYQALCLQLEHSRAHGSLEAVVIAIENGLLVAGAGARQVCEALGAVAPLLADEAPCGVMPNALDGRIVDVRMTQVDGEVLYVASAGAAKSDAWLRRSVDGARRILQGRRHSSQFVVN